MPSPPCVDVSDLCISPLDGGKVRGEASYLSGTCQNHHHHIFIQALSFAINWHCNKYTKTTYNNFRNKTSTEIK